MPPTEAALSSGASQHEAQWLTEQLRSSRLTVLCGEPGEPMSELLTDGVLPRLQRRAGDRQPPPPPQRTVQSLPFADRREPRRDAAEVCVYFDHWGESPRHVLVEKLLDAVGERGRRAAAGDGLPVRLGEKLTALSQRFGLRFLIILDHFETCLTAPPERPDLRALRDELFAAINQPDLPAQFLIALREDGEPLMHLLRQRVDGFDAERKPLHGAQAQARGPGALSSVAAPAPEAAVEPPASRGAEAVYSTIEQWLERNRSSDASEAAAAASSPASTAAQADAEPEPFGDAEAPAGEAVELPAFERAERAAAPDLAFSAPLRAPTTVTPTPTPMPAELSSESLAELERVAGKVADYVQALAEPQDEPGEFRQLEVVVPAVEAPVERHELPTPVAAAVEAEAAPELATQPVDEPEPEVVAAPPAVAVMPIEAPAAEAPVESIDDLRHARPEPTPFDDDRAESSLFVDTVPGHDFDAEPESRHAPLAADFASSGAPEPPLVQGIDFGLKRKRAPQFEDDDESLPSLPPRAARSMRGSDRAPWRGLLAIVGAVALVAAIGAGLWWRPGAKDEATLAAAPQGGRFTTLEAAVAPNAAALRGRVPLTAGDALAARIGDDLSRAIAGAGGPGIAVQGSRGWFEDLAGVRDGTRLVITRYDALQAARGDSGAGPLRIVMPLFAEELAFVVRADSPLRWIHQVEGRRINIGPGNGARALTVRSAYARLFNKPLPTERSSLAGEAAALDELLGRSVDVVVLVGNAPAPWAGAYPEMAGGLRLLALDRNHPSTQRALRAMRTATLDPGPDAGPETPPTPTLAVMSFLVAGEGGGAATARVGSDAAAPVDVARVAAALCRQLPALQRDGHPKWREVQPALQLEAGWPYAAEAQDVLRDCASGAAPAPKADPVQRPAVRSPRTAALGRGASSHS